MVINGLLFSQTKTLDHSIIIDPEMFSVPKSFLICSIRKRFEGIVTVAAMLLVDKLGRKPLMLIRAGSLAVYTL